MQRVVIRNTQSTKKVKPRVFDALVDENADVYLEVKNGKSSERIALSDVLNQIEGAMVISSSDLEK